MARETYKSPIRVILTTDSAVLLHSRFITKKAESLLDRSDNGHRSIPGRKAQRLTVRITGPEYESRHFLNA